jgi:hypothetical protein
MRGVKSPIAVGFSDRNVFEVKAALGVGDCLTSQTGQQYLQPCRGDLEKAASLLGCPVVQPACEGRNTAAWE